MNADDIQYANWVDNLGVTEIPANIHIPFHLFQTCTTCEDLIQFVYPPNMLNNLYEIIQHAILCPLNVQVAKYNSQILNLLTGTQTTYYSSNSIVEDDSSIDNPLADIDHLNSMRLPGIPDHELRLKIGAICVLTCNFSIEKNLTKNTKVSSL